MYSGVAGCFCKPAPVYRAVGGSIGRTQVDSTEVGGVRCIVYFLTIYSWFSTGINLSLVVAYFRV